MKQDDPNDALTVPISRVARFYGTALFGLFVLFLLACLIYSALHAPFSATLYGAEWSTTFLANLAVVYFGFSAFNRTKARPWLYLASAALIHAFFAFLIVLIDAMQLRGTLAYWLHVSSLVGGAAGMFLYASGVVSLARRTSGPTRVGSSHTLTATAAVLDAAERKRDQMHMGPLARPRTGFDVMKAFRMFVALTSGSGG